MCVRWVNSTLRNSATVWLTGPPGQLARRFAFVPNILGTEFLKVSRARDWPLATKGLAPNMPRRSQPFGQHPSIRFAAVQWLRRSLAVDAAKET
jgi:hypothetical protein